MDKPKQTSTLPSSSVKQAAPAATSAKICNNNNNSSSLDNHLKVKRCKHGRIIVKDTSKKKHNEEERKHSSSSNLLAKHVIAGSHRDHQKSQHHHHHPNHHHHRHRTPPKQQQQISEPPKQPKTLEKLNIPSRTAPQQPPPQAPPPPPQQQQQQPQKQPTSQRQSDQHLDSSPRKQTIVEKPTSIDQATPSDNSPNSDIYDPEGPIIPISPVDSPPLSLIDETAYNKIHYRLHDDDKSNDDDMPSSAVQLNQQEKYIQKLNRQERVIEEVKIALKPHYQKRYISKEQYKDVLRRAVPKICHSKNGEINPVKIRSLVEAYVKKLRSRNR